MSLTKEEALVAAQQARIYPRGHGFAYAVEDSKTQILDPDHPDYPEDGLVNIDDPEDVADLVEQGALDLARC
jgi:hypothetical protein